MLDPFVFVASPRCIVSALQQWSSAESYKACNPAGFSVLAGLQTNDDIHLGAQFSFRRAFKQLSTW